MEGSFYSTTVYPFRKPWSERNEKDSYQAFHKPCTALVLHNGFQNLPGRLMPTTRQLSKAQATIKCSSSKWKHPDNYTTPVFWMQNSIIYTNWWKHILTITYNSLNTVFSTTLPFIRQLDKERLEMESCFWSVVSDVQRSESSDNGILDMIGWCIHVLWLGNASSLITECKWVTHDVKNDRRVRWDLEILLQDSGQWCHMRNLSQALKRW